ATLSCIMLRSRSVRLVEVAEPFPQRLRSGCKDRVERRLNLLRVDVVIRTSVDESLHSDVEVGLGSLGLYRRHACAVDPLPCPLFRRTQIFGSGSAGLAALAGMEWQTVVAIGALALGGLLIALLLRRQILCAVQDVRKMIER